MKDWTIHKGDCIPHMEPESPGERLCRYEADWRSPCGRVELFLGDSMFLLQGMRRGSVDAVVTDPPYSSGGIMRGDRMLGTNSKYSRTGSLVGQRIAEFTGDNRDQRAFLAWSSLWSGAALDASRAGALIATWTDWRQLPITSDAIQAGGWVWRGIACWQKINARPVSGRFRNQAEFIVWGTNGGRELEGKCIPGWKNTEAELVDLPEVPGWIVAGPESEDVRVHITQKPVDVMKWAIAPTLPGEIILDPFMGSGSTGVAAVSTGRRFVGFEKSTEHFETAVGRLQNALSLPVTTGNQREVQQRLFAGQQGEE